MQIPRRNVEMQFDPEKVRRDWAGGDPFVTTFVGALSLLFPEGERFFVDSVKQLRESIEDPELMRQVVGFIGQEAMHGKEHRALNEMLAAHGYAVAPLVEARLRRLLQRGRHDLAPRTQLAVTCALEHFTAILAEALLRHPRLQAEFDDDVRPLWLWHALEESEHKAVAFDVYRTCDGGYLRRAAVMIGTTAIFFAVLALVHARLMATRRVLWKPWRWRGALRLWVWPGHLTRLVPAYLGYFRPGFHPDDRDTRLLLETWRGRLFDAGGLLEGRVEIADAA